MLNINKKMIICEKPISYLCPVFKNFSIFSFVTITFKVHKFNFLNKLMPN